MDLVEIIELRKLKSLEIQNLIQAGKAEVRVLTEAEETNIESLKNEIQGLENQIEEINNRNNNKKNKMENTFKDLIVRNGDNIENMQVRALVLSSGIDNVSVAGNISTVGYEPFWKQMGVEYMPNLNTSIKLPYVSTNITGAKVAEGNKNATNNTVATVTLQPQRFTLQETVGKEILAVGNEAALQAFLNEMAKGCDKAITKEVFDVVIAGATAVTGLTSYTTSNIDTLVAKVDGDVTVLMPRLEFYKAKGVKIDTYSGLFLANKKSQFAAEMWDGTPAFYSQLFANSTIAVADLKHVTVGEFGDTYEIIFDNYTKAGEGQVVITVTKFADVKLRNANAVRKALIA